MRQRFSERHGLKDIREALQIEAIDEALKSRLWNAIQKYYIDAFSLNHYNNFSLPKDINFIKTIFDNFFKTHEEPPMRKYDFKQNFQTKYFNLQWYEIYDLIEFLPDIFHQAQTSVNFRKDINTILEDEMSGYRFVDSFIVQIVEEVEIQAVEDAMENSLAGVKQHISNAIEHLSDRENPDYVNSIKESISAVESMCKNFLGNNSALGSCLTQLSFDFSPAFKSAMTKMYNWTSQEGGIRHGSTDEELTITFEDAKYMLVICSAFVNYLIAKKGA